MAEEILGQIGGGVIGTRMPPVPTRPPVTERIIIGLDDRTLFVFESLLATQKAQSATLKRIEKGVKKLMAEVDDAAKVLDGITREVGQIVPFIRTLIEQVQAGATDKALASLIRAKLPDLQASVTALDEFTPEPPVE